MQSQSDLTKYIEGSSLIQAPVNDQSFYGHGKVLLSGEYFVLDGAKALGLPTKVGQGLSVKYSSSFEPRLYWKSFDPAGNLWFEAQFEFWHFNIVGDNPAPEAVVLQSILRQVRKQNTHFLRDDVDIHVDTRLGFPLDWGLGSSSTLIHNIAQWAYISPFELLFKTLGGSGYDIACAQSDGPILYHKTSEGPNWSPVIFDPSFKENLFFVHLDKKQNSRHAIEYYNKKKPHAPEVIQTVSDLTDQIATSRCVEDFNFNIKAHEEIIGKNLNMTPVKEQFFSSFEGEVKSLGAWGGDFILVSSSNSKKYVSEYFENKGLKVVIPYKELILNPHIDVNGSLNNVH